MISSSRVLRRAGRAGVLAAELWPTGSLGYWWSTQLTASRFQREPLNSRGFVKKLLRAVLNLPRRYPCSKTVHSLDNSPEFRVDEVHFDTHDSCGPCRLCCFERPLCGYGEHSASFGLAAGAVNPGVEVIDGQEILGRLAWHRKHGGVLGAWDQNHGEGLASGMAIAQPDH